jgi:hypothetical protein
MPAFRLISQQLSNGKTTVRIDYNDYKLIDNQWIPEHLSATLLGADKKH